jgi:hypothetical protein
MTTVSQPDQSSGKAQSAAAARPTRAAPSMDADLAAKPRALAERVRRHVPDRRDPDRFHTEKSCICQDLERVAEFASGQVAGDGHDALQLKVPR